MEVSLTVAESNSPPDTEWAKRICLIGQGSECCRYLTMGAHGWSCEKHGTLRAHIDKRALTHVMHAKGDNCPGRTSQ